MSSFRNAGFHGSVCVALLVATLLASPTMILAQDSGLVIEKDVVYTTAGGQPLHMDIARPEQGDGPFPLVVCIHGGGWSGGNKNAFAQGIRGFAKQGYVAATVQYRLVPTARFPSQLEDVKCAVRYLRSRAKELKIDPDRIGVMGASAGGHLALLIGVTDKSAGLEGEGYLDQSSRVKAVVNFFGPTDLTQPYAPNVQPLLTGLIGGTTEQKPKETAQASPITHLSKDDPPILTFHGTADNIVPYSQATILDEACKKAGVPHELVGIENGGHGFGGPEGLMTLQRMVDFFNKHLKGTP